MAGAPFGFGLILVFLSIMNYLVDAYTIFAASVLAANSILRSLFGAAFPLFTVQMYDKLGLHWASTIPAFLALVCVPFPYLFYIYGARIRTHCKFAAESDAFMQSLKQAQDQREQGLEEQDNSTEDERTVVDEGVITSSHRRTSSVHGPSSLYDGNPYDIDRVHTRNSFS
ncbi:hypothetical protein H9Q73_008016 [Fusarium xylarioides]|nr:hypothetical protein H9Q73_008016 [Fusarium xylarioides]